MLTLLTHLELGEVQYLCLLPQMNVTCTLNFHNVGGKCVFDICLYFALLACLHVLMGSRYAIFVLPFYQKKKKL
jgi:hypothetical protein